MSRFKTDENVHPDAAVLLRTNGHDAATVWDQSLRGEPDHRLADICQHEGRALITFDLGFADIRIYSPKDYSGFIVLRLNSQDRESTMAALDRLVPMLAHQSAQGQLWIVDERTIRIRGEDEQGTAGSLAQ